MLPVLHGLLLHGIIEPELYIIRDTVKRYAFRRICFWKPAKLQVIPSSKCTCTLRISKSKKNLTWKASAKCAKSPQTDEQNEPKTTWDLAKISIPNNISRLREREKIYRRLLVGRKDNGKHSNGILELGLVVKDGKSLKTGVADKYRLSLYGILYCIDVMDLTKNEIDGVAKKYSSVLPKVFGRWEMIKEKMGNKVYGIKLLANGLLADNPQIQVQPGIPFLRVDVLCSHKVSEKF